MSFCPTCCWSWWSWCGDEIDDDGGVIGVGGEFTMVRSLDRMIAIGRAIWNSRISSFLTGSPKSKWQYNNSQKFLEIYLNSQMSRGRPWEEVVRWQRVVGVAVTLHCTASTADSWDCFYFDHSATARSLDTQKSQSLTTYRVRLTRTRTYYRRHLSMTRSHLAAVHSLPMPMGCVDRILNWGWHRVVAAVAVEIIRRFHDAKRVALMDASRSAVAKVDRWFVNHSDEELPKNLNLHQLKWKI